MLIKISQKIEFMYTLFKKIKTSKYYTKIMIKLLLTISLSLLFTSGAEVMAHYVDLTRTITDRMQVWPGDVELRLEQMEKVLQEYQVSNQTLSCSLHIGTHIDAPGHMIIGSKKISDFGPEKFIGNGVLIDARGKSVITASMLDGISLDENSIVLILTGHSVKFGEPSYYEYPVMDESCAQKLQPLM